jgi:hypothetical protein
VRDLGSDNYNLPGYWDRKRGGKRWNYYRLNSKSHSVPLLGGEDQDPLATSRITHFLSTKYSQYALIDLTSAYQTFATKVTRGVSMLSGKAVLVQDEFEIKEPCELIWAMTTDAKIDIDENVAKLTLKDRELKARILSPDRTSFSTESAEQESPQKKNKGVKRLIMRLPKAEGNVRVAVLLSPLWEEGFVHSVPIKPLSEW